MKGHAAFPQEEDAHRVVQIFGELVEQHVAEPPAQHRAKHAKEQDVVEIASGPAKPGLGPDAVTSEHEHDDEGEQVHQSVPAHRQRAEMKGYGIELRMDEHGGAREVGELYVSVIPELC